MRHGGVDLRTGGAATSSKRLLVWPGALLLQAPSVLRRSMCGWRRVRLDPPRLPVGAPPLPLPILAGMAPDLSDRLLATAATDRAWLPLEPVRVVDERAAVFADGGHDCFPANPVLRRHLRDGVAVLTGPTARFAPRAFSHRARGRITSLVSVQVRFRQSASTQCHTRLIHTKVTGRPPAGSALTDDPQSCAPMATNAPR